MLGGGEIGERIRRLRKNAGLNQETLADYVGVHINTISRWENGIDIPKTLKLKKLAAALNVTEAELLNGPEPKEFEIKIVMGVKNLTGLAGMEVADNSFIYGVQDDKPQIHLAGKIMIGTPEEREKAKAMILEKFERACWMFDHRDVERN